MAIDRKYGRVVLQYGNIELDEPVIVIRAQDALSCPAISAYYKLCEGRVEQEHLTAIEKAYIEFADWQEAHRDQVKLPDTTPAQMDEDDRRYRGDIRL